MNITATISCHFSDYTEQVSVEELINQADNALYQGQAVTALLGEFDILSNLVTMTSVKYYKSNGKIEKSK